MKKLALLSTALALAAGASFAQTPYTTPPGGTSTTTTTTTNETTATAGSVSYYTTLSKDDMRASKLIGTDVYNTKNENIGEIEDLLLNKSNNVQAVILSVGGFLGVGDRLVAVKPEALALTKQSDGTFKVVINLDKAALQKAPEFNTDATVRTN